MLGPVFYTEIRLLRMRSPTLDPSSSPPWVAGWKRDKQLSIGQCQSQTDTYSRVYMAQPFACIETTNSITAKTNLKAATLS